MRRPRARASAKLPGVEAASPSARAHEVPRAREVIALALPALGALAAEPLYVLGDTAIVGHLGRVPLAGLAIAGTLLSEVVGLCTFLEYGTTAKAARLYGAGQQPEALDVGVQATWLALALGTRLRARARARRRPGAAPDRGLRATARRCTRR